MKQRDNTILDLLSESGRMEVSLLAEKLGVSQVTIRKDLDALERKGVIRREHGYAVFGGTDDLNNRLAIHYEEKQSIARAAAGLVTAGETVMMVHISKLREKLEDDPKKPEYIVTVRGLGYKLEK